MNWSDVAETVAKVAPAAGGALGGPAGAAVGSVIARVLGVDASPEAVRQALQGDPEAAFKLREVEARIETSLIQGRAQVVTAEAQGDSWLQRSWRPITMLSFVLLVAVHWLGITPDTLADSHVEMVMDIIQLGLGGYVIGRSAEKITRTASGAGIFDHLKAKARK